MDFPVILHILSYNNDEIYRLISKRLSEYCNGKKSNSFKLPISLLIKTNMHMEYSTMILSSRFRSKICRIAARVGNLSALQWVRNPVTPNGRSEDLLSCPWDTPVCSEAAAGGHLELLQWARSQGCPWDRMT